MSVDENEPKKKLPFQLGQDLSDLSVGDIEEIIDQLEEEIARLQTDAKQKQASKSVADALFKS
ncbi:MAG: DUF1192 domain-containing protein [Pseudomonadota bacterium]